MTVTKNMSRGFQLIAGFTRQWHKIDGTWNPTDPARFVQPNHFANDANLYMPRGNNDGNSLPDTGNALSYGPTWMKYRGNLGGVWQAPWEHQRGRQRHVPGRALVGIAVVSAGGQRSRRPQVRAGDVHDWRTDRPPPNPLATRNRYVFSDRGEGQVQAPMITTVGLKIGKVAAVSALPGGGGGELLQPAQRW